MDAPDGFSVNRDQTIDADIQSSALFRKVRLPEARRPRSEKTAFITQTDHID